MCVDGVVVCMLVLWCGVCVSIDSGVVCVLVLWCVFSVDSVVVCVLTVLWCVC